MKPELEKAIQNIKKQHGAGAIMKLGSSDKLDVEVISSGSIALDYAMGIGGFPKGRICEIFGSESSGKTTIALHLIAEAQKLGGVCAFIDAENSLDPSYARALGVDTSELLVSQPSCGEEALEIADSLISSGEISVVIVDSVAALTPRCEIEGEMGQSMMGVQAKLMSQGLRKLTAVTYRTKTILVFINQLREKIGVMYGSPEVTSGGKALKFFSSIRLDVRKVSTNTVDNIKVSNETKITVKKNKLSAPFKEAKVEIIFGSGISNKSDIISLGAEHKLLDKSGAWITIGKDKIQGIDAAVEYLKTHEDVSNKLEQSLREKLFGK